MADAITNGSFESDLGSWTGVNASVSTVKAQSGTKSVTRTGAGEYSVEQDVSALGLRFDQLLTVGFYVYSSTASEGNPAVVNLLITFSDADTYTNNLSSTTPNNWVAYADIKPCSGTGQEAKIVKSIKLTCDAECDYLDSVSVIFAWVSDIGSVSAYDIDRHDARGGSTTAEMDGLDGIEFGLTDPLSRDYGGVDDLAPMMLAVDGGFAPPVTFLTSKLIPLLSMLWDRNVAANGRTIQSVDLNPIEGWYTRTTKTTLSGYLLDRVQEKPLPSYYISFTSPGYCDMAISRSNGIYVAFLDPNIKSLADLASLDLFAFKLDSKKGYNLNTDLISETVVDGTHYIKQLNLIGDLFFSRFVRTGAFASQQYPWRKGT